MPAPRILTRFTRTHRAPRHVIAALLLPAILLLQLSCDCAAARAASAPQAHAAAHACCPDSGHRPAPTGHDHDPACAHCQLALAPSGGLQMPSSHLAAWPAFLALVPRPQTAALGSSASLLSITDRAGSDMARLRTCVLLL
jgi:hypothetical protein